MVEIKANKVFYETKEAFENGAEVVIHKGGTGSGKTYDICLWLLIYYALKNNNKIITIVSESVPHLNIGVKRYIDKTLIETNLITQTKVKSYPASYLLPNNSLIELFSTDRIDKALGARRDVLYGNEINSLKQNVWDELARRSKFIIGDFNPTVQFWLEDWAKNYDNVKIIKSNYKDNPLLPEYERKRIEKRCKHDANFKRVHIDCEYGNVEDLVFKPEQIKVIEEFPSDLKYTYGLDFGFVAPSSFVKVGETEDAVYIDEVFYRSQMNNNDYKQELEKIGKHDVITADSEDTRMISYIGSLGYNIRKADKKKGSVAFGVAHLQGKTIYITKNSVNTINEYRNYGHLKDKDGNLVKGKYVGEDHSIDATRYTIKQKSNNTISFNL